MFLLSFLLKSLFLFELLFPCLLLHQCSHRRVRQQRSCITCFQKTRCARFVIVFALISVRTTLCVVMSWSNINHVKLNEFNHNILYLPFSLKCFFSFPHLSLFFCFSFFSPFLCPVSLLPRISFLSASAINKFLSIDAINT